MAQKLRNELRVRKINRRKMDVNISVNALESFTQQTVADVFADCFPAGPGTTCTV